MLTYFSFQFQFSVDASSSQITKELIAVGEGERNAAKIKEWPTKYSNPLISLV